MANFDFESVYVKTEELEDMETTTWIEKRNPTSVSIPSNLLEDPFHFHEINTGDLVPFLIEMLETLATQSQAQRKMTSLQFEPKIRRKHAQNLKNLYERRTHRIDIEENCLEDDSDNVSTQFSQVQKNQYLISKITLRDLTCQYQSLDSSVQLAILRWTRPIYLPTLLLNKTRGN